MTLTLETLPAKPAAITLDIPGTPTAKGRPRHRVMTTRGGKTFAQTYTPAQTRHAEDNFQAHALWIYQHEHGRPPEPTRAALHVSITFYLTPPKGLLSVKKRYNSNLAAMAAGRLCPAGKPDLDNLCKLAWDALNGIFWGDDAQIVTVTAQKRYDVKRPHTVLTIEEIGGGDE